MSDRDGASKQDLDKLLAEAAPYADFLRTWREHAEDLDAFIDSYGNQSGVQPEAPTNLQPETVPAWWYALAASTSGVDRSAAAEDWWVLRPAFGGGVLYIGNPERAKEDTGWGAVIVTLPDQQVSGTVLYSSVDLMVVLLNPPAAP